MEMCISAAEDDVRMKCMKVVRSMLKEEVDKAQSLLGSSHDKVVKVIMHCLRWVQQKFVVSQLACCQHAITSFIMVIN